jgi:hypothetical protein
MQVELHDAKTTGPCSAQATFPLTQSEDVGNRSFPAHEIQLSQHRPYRLSSAQILLKHAAILLSVLWTGYGRQRMDMQVTPRIQLQVWNKHEGGKREQPEVVRGGLRRLEELRNWLYETLGPQSDTTS